MSEMIENALKRATDTKACRIGDGVLGDTVTFFRESRSMGRKTWIYAASRASGPSSKTVSPSISTFSILGMLSGR